MWVQSYSKIYQNVKKEDIWRLWADIDNWHKWHGDLDYCKLAGDFKAGNYFMLKPKGMKAFKIDLMEIVHGQKFTDCTKFFGAKMYDTHEMEETKEGLRLSNKLVVTGPLKFLWIKLVAQNVANTVPGEMDALVNLARSQT
jgi:hypothetical protein